MTRSHHQQSDCMFLLDNQYIEVPQRQNRFPPHKIGKPTDQNRFRTCLEDMRDKTTRRYLPWLGCKSALDRRYIEGHHQWSKGSLGQDTTPLGTPQLGEMQHL
jgi:hypothetical protein